MSGGDSGPTRAQKKAQKEQLRLAKDAEARELERERSLKVRVLARQRARRFGQFGRQSLAFNPGAQDLGATPVDRAPDTRKQARKQARKQVRQTLRQGDGSIIDRVFASLSQAAESRIRARAPRVASAFGRRSAPTDQTPRFRTVST